MKLSVIVCTRNRSHAILDCLESVRAAFEAAAPVEGELVVVDNASTDDTSAIVQHWARRSGLTVRLEREARRGLAAARNRGIRTASGELLALTDDDCRMDRNYVIDLLLHDAADTDLVLRGGRVDLGDPGDLPLTIKTDRSAGRWSRAMNSARHFNLGNCMLGCNMVMPRDAVTRIGLFDERLGAGTRIPAGEDTDYVFRAYLEGITIEYVPDMAVAHHHGRKLASQGRALNKSYAVGAGALYAKYMFKDRDVCRQLGWDIKDAVREIFSAGRASRHRCSFSTKDKIAYYLVGACKFAALPGRRTVALRMRDESGSAIAAAGKILPR
jgi:GT2 family glycosyltransferase